MYAVVDATPAGMPNARGYNDYAALYVVVAVIFFGFLLANLLLSGVVDSYDSHTLSGAVSLNKTQNIFLRTYRLMIDFRPRNIPRFGGLGVLGLVLVVAVFWLCFVALLFACETASTDFFFAALSFCSVCFVFILVRTHSCGIVRFDPFTPSPLPLFLSQSAFDAHVLRPLQPQTHRR
jgi:hypothetical protein